jgi:hypothetical protein
MSRWIPRLFQPVRRHSAEVYLLLMLLSFAASLTLTRLLLHVTGYPQLGGGNLHIAHVLWGGLILFVAALLPLIFANRWAYALGAVLAGLGIGLFIDEVGKFITQNNDYFYAPAAPIIYAFFLLSVLLYLQVRRPRPRDARTELYAALQGLEDVLDHDLEPDEQVALLARLRFAQRHAVEPDTRRLAETLLEFLGPGVRLAPERPDVFERLLLRWEAIQMSWFGRRRLKAALVVGLAALGTIAAARLAQLLLATRNTGGMEELIANLVTVGRLNNAAGLAWFTARAALEGMVGGILLVAAALLALGKDRLATGLGSFGLLLSLAAVNLLVFYFDQFSTIALASAQFLAFLGLLYYQGRHTRP